MTRSPRRPRAKWRTWGLLAAVVIAAGVGTLLVGNGTSEPVAAQHWVVHVRETLDHDPGAFTQGLEWFEGKLYESTGLNGRSSIRRIDLPTGRVEQQVDLAEELFGEGLTRVGSELIQLTWQSGRALRWNVRSFERTGEMTYSGEGWGICLDGDRLVMSNGSSELTLRDPRTFEARGTVQVLLGGRPLANLNELECVDGTVYANVWQSTRIAVIDLATGRVRAMVETGRLLSDAERQTADVLNGIAWLPDRRAFYITGKLWPKAFIVEFGPAEAD